jgi:hypothetical protein
MVQTERTQEIKDGLVAAVLPVVYRPSFLPVLPVPVPKTVLIF